MEYAEKSVELADRSGDSFQRMVRRATLGDALHQMGQLSKAEVAFLEAEGLQKEIHPEFPMLFEVSSFRYCDLLLGQGKYIEVEERVRRFFEWGQHSISLLGIALEHLSLGRAYSLQTKEKTVFRLSDATIHLNQALNGLRQAGRIDFIPLGLLGRAELSQIKGDFKRAKDDLGEAMSITAGGGMRLYQADCHLEYARLHLAQGEKAKAREHWTKARDMVDEMGYHRRDKDVAEIAEQLGEEV